MLGIIKTSRRKILLKDQPLVMGILNVTPDSFSDGGRYFDSQKAFEYALQMKKDGADIIDIGGESTRPGADPVSVEEELDRVLPVIEKIADAMDIPLSIDTTKSEVADKALRMGVEIVNDISGLRFDDKMAEVVAKHKAAVVIMHIRKTPKDMQEEIVYDSLLDDILHYFEDATCQALASGISEQSIIIDPGIGFGKTVEHNLTILKNLDYFKILGYPIMIGTSMKSFIGKVLDLPVDERLEGTIAVDAFTSLKGVNIIRTHNVVATRRALAMTDAINGSPTWI